MIWTTATVAVECGLCGRRLDRGERIALVTEKHKVRCPDCVARNLSPPAVVPDLGEDLKLDDEDAAEVALNAEVEATVENFREHFRAPEPIPPVLRPREPGSDDE